MLRSVAVFGLAFAGVFVLAGPGWALLAAAALCAVLWRREPDWRSHALRARSWLLTAWGAVRAAPRRSAAAGGMTGGVALTPAGFGVAFGPGAALITGGILVTGVALMLGWNA